MDEFDGLDFDDRLEQEEDACLPDLHGDVMGTSLAEDMFGGGLDEPFAGSDEEITACPPLPIAQDESAEPVAADVSSSNPGPRRRMRAKTVISPGSAWFVSQSPSPDACTANQGPPVPQEPWWAEKSHKQKYDYIYNLVRRHGWREFRKHMAAEPGPQPEMPEFFSRCSKADKAKVVVHWLLRGRGQKQPLCVMHWVRQHFCMTGPGRPQTQYGQRFRSKQFLFTCNGDWGLATLPGDLSLSPDPGTAAMQLRELEDVQKIWLRVQEETARLVVRISADDYAVCLELCGKTLKATGTIRLHCHIACMSARSMSIWVNDERATSFLDGKFMITTEDSRRKRSPGWQTFYYVLAPKVGQLYQYTTKAPYDDFAVDANWIWNLVQSQKLGVSEARKELVRSCKCLTRHLPNVDRVRSELVALHLHETIAAKEVEFAKARKPFKALKQVDELLQALAKPAERRKFLVLDGPSRMGKTQCAMSLFGRLATLEVNAAEEETPNLQDFDPQKHRCVLLDEAPPVMVLRNRKLFQCPNALVQLGQSKTNCHSYSVYLNDTLLIICSNSWACGVSRSPAAEADWIRANQVLITITEPMWQTTD